MIVCLCRGKNDRAVAAAIREGNTCLQDLYASGIGGVCHGCDPTLVDMIRALAPQSGREACAECCVQDEEQVVSA